MAELKSLQNTKICYPTNDIWFICWDNTRENIMAYGLITPEQCMETHWTEIDYYDNEIEWGEVLIANGINPFPDDEITGNP